MELKKIIDILQEFNDYRRSQGKFADEDKTIRDLQYSPKEIGDAIDEVINRFKRQIELSENLWMGAIGYNANSCINEIKPTQSMIGKIGNESVVCSKEPFEVMYAQESRTVNNNCHTNI